MFGKENKLNQQTEELRLSMNEKFGLSIPQGSTLVEINDAVSAFTSAPDPAVTEPVVATTVAVEPVAPAPVVAEPSVNDERLTNLETNVANLNTAMGQMVKGINQLVTSNNTMQSTVSALAAAKNKTTIAPAGTVLVGAAEPAIIPNNPEPTVETKADFSFMAAYFENPNLTPLAFKQSLNK